MVDTLYVVTAVHDTLKLALQSNSSFYLQLIPLLIALSAIIVSPLIQLYIVKKKIKFSTLHQKRANIIAELYSSIINAKQKMINLTMTLQINSTPLSEKKSEAIESINQLKDVFSKHRIYFSHRNCNQLDYLIDIMRDSYYIFDSSQHGEEYEPEGRDGGWSRSWRQVDGEIKPITEELEKEFRQLLNS